jgi:hypothetical protein
MTFTHSHQDLQGNTVSSITYTVYDDGGIHDVMQEFRRFLLAVSFQPETVDKYIEAE